MIRSGFAKLKTLSASLLLVAVVMCGDGMAQSSCSSCNSVNGNPDYRPCHSGCCGCGEYLPGLDPDCRNRKDFSRRFFDCCTPSISDLPVFDPCCRLPYFTAYAGYATVQDLERPPVRTRTVNVVNSGTPPTFADYVAVERDVNRQIRFTFADGYAAGGTVGYRVHPQLRLEIDFRYQYNRFATFEEDKTVTRTRFNNPALINGVPLSSQSTSSSVAADGALNTYSGMGNILYDISCPRLRCLNLFAGGGIGLGHVVGDALTSTTAYRIESSSFAYQLICGVNIPVTRKIDFFSEYRYLGADNLSMTNQTRQQDMGRFGIDTHNVNFGLHFYPGRARGFRN